MELSAGLDNAPKIYRTYFDNAGDFVIELGWFANASLTLEHRSELSTGTWDPVEGFTLTDSGLSVLQLSHTPSGSSGFYRVLEN